MVDPKDAEVAGEDLERTSSYLFEDQSEALVGLSKETGLSVSGLRQRAVDKFLVEAGYREESRFEKDIKEFLRQE